MDHRTLKRELGTWLVKNWSRDGVATHAATDLVQAARHAASRIALSRPEPTDRAVLDEVVTEVGNALFIYGPLAMLLLDPAISEIMVNGPQRVFIERDGQRSLSPVKFATEGELRSVVERLVALDPSKRLDAGLPYVDVAAPDGARINIAVPPVVLGGPHVTIRKFSGVVESLDDLVAADALDERMAQFLYACLRARANLLFAGAAGVGKTTLLEILASHIPADERVVVIEDTLELHLSQPNVVRMMARTPNLEGKGQITIGDLFKNSLRMRPGRIIVGELRGGEAFDYLQALSSGHLGSLAVVHASSPEEALLRIETLVRYSAHDIPAAVVRRQMAAGLDVVVQMNQMTDGARRVTRIAEVAGQDGDGAVLTRDIFRFVGDAVTQSGRLLGHYEATGVVPTLDERFPLAGVPLPRSFYDAVEEPTTKEESAA